MTKNRASLLFLLALIAVALCFAFIIMKPFLKPIVFASAIAIVFYPLHIQVRRLIRKPWRRARAGRSFAPEFGNSFRIFVQDLSSNLKM